MSKGNAIRRVFDRARELQPAPAPPHQTTPPQPATPPQGAPPPIR